MSSTSRLHSILLGVAAVISSLLGLATLFVWSILAVVFGVATVVFLLGLLAIELRRDSPTDDALVRRATEHAEAGRKLAIYERETGLFAHWYVALRGEEECNRAARHNKSLTLLVTEPEPGPNVWVIQGQLAEWLRSHLRAIDVASYLGNGRYLVLMPETDTTRAHKAVERLHRRIDCAQTGLSSFPNDGVTFEQLYAAARDRLSEAARQAA